MESLLIEIGTEEIPSGYIEPALDAFRNMLVERLRKERIACGEVMVYGTPRRLTVMAFDVALRQEPFTTEVTGPPERVGYDENGHPTVAARKFAEKNGVSVNRLSVRETEKGRYLCIQKTDKGQKTVDVLRREMPGLILSIPFPKTMRWKALSIAFARPVHSVTALFGERSFSFTVGDIKSGRNTFGHRFLAPGKIRLDHPGQYLRKLEEAFVIGDPARRKALMLKRMAHAAAGTGGRIVDDPGLCDVVVNLVEYPEVVLGSFDARFLGLPPEILVTAMREHQRYFAVMDEDNKMLPHFIAVSNNRANNMDVVVSGYERVLAARLEDARFFYESDRKISLDRMAEKLKDVVFQADLGSVRDKTQRIRRLCGYLAAAAGLEETDARRLDRAAFLCKADLVSQVVIEFPKLQGVIGRIYAGKAGEDPLVASAIEEHYRPVQSGGALPETMIGALLSVADKLDSLCGCFHIGLIPTGASDPYALRRQAIGLIQIARENDLDLSLDEVVRFGLGLFDGPAAKPNDAVGQEILGFLKNRMAHMLEEEAVPRDMAAAVLAVSADNVVDVWSRAGAFARMKTLPDFQSLAVAFKRVVNIIRKADPAETREGKVDPGLFEHSAETLLYEAFERVEQAVNRHLDNRDARSAFAEIASIREPVDRFFDDVMVMADDAVLRKNRLALLRRISDLFARLADFSRLSA